MPPFLLLLLFPPALLLLSSLPAPAPAPTAPPMGLDETTAEESLDSLPWYCGQLAFSAALPVALASSSCVLPGSLSTGKENRTAPSASTALTARSSRPETGSSSRSSALAAASPSRPGRAAWASQQEPSKPKTSRSKVGKQASKKPRRLSLGGREKRVFLLLLLLRSRLRGEKKRRQSSSLFDGLPPFLFLFSLTGSLPGTARRRRRRRPRATWATRARR